MFRERGAGHFHELVAFEPQDVVIAVDEIPK
jgi:hypothetical protein